MSGRAPRGSAPSSATSTVTVPFRAAGSMRTTRPGTRELVPLRVSTSAFWPMATSFTCVSATCSCAFNRVGSTTRARFVPGPMRCPTCTGTSCSTPATPARIFRPVASDRLSAAIVSRRRTSDCCTDELHRQRALAVGEPLLFHLLPRRRRFGEQARAAKLNRGDEPVLRHLLVGVGVHRGLCRIGRHARGRGALREQVALEIGLEHFVVVLRGAQIEIGRHGGLLRLRIAELDEHGIGLDRSSGQHDHALDGSVGQRGDPANFIGHEHAGASHVAQHGSALHRFNPQPAGLDSRRSRLESREGNSRNKDQQRGGDTRNDAVALLALGDFRGSGNIHLSISLVAQELLPAPLRPQTKGVFPRVSSSI